MQIYVVAHYVYNNINVFFSIKEAALVCIDKLSKDPTIASTKKDWRIETLQEERDLKP